MLDALKAKLDSTAVDAPTVTPDSAALDALRITLDPVALDAPTVAFVSAVLGAHAAKTAQCSLSEL